MVRNVVKCLPTILLPTKSVGFSSLAEKDNGGGAFSLYSTMRHVPRSLLTIIASKQQLFKFDYLSKIPLASVIR